MKDQLQQTIEFLRQHVLKNIDLIKANEAHIKEVLNWPLNIDRTNELNESYSFSKNLLSENNDFINLQVSIMNFNNKYKKVFDTEQPVKVEAFNSVNNHSQISRDDYFRLTVEKDIAYNSSHPYFGDTEFYRDLLNYYKESENYEKCAILLKTRM